MPSDARGPRGGRRAWVRPEPDVRPEPRLVGSTRPVRTAGAVRPPPASPRQAPPAPAGGGRPARRGRRLLRLVVVLAVLGAAGVVAYRRLEGPHLSPLRSRIVAIAQGQLGYQTDPSDSYCNKYSAHFSAGADTCPAGLLSEEWCADFAAWVWQQAGAEVTYQFVNGDLNSSSASFYEWGRARGTWHPVGSGYVPQPGDVAVYGLDAATLTAQHVAVVTAVPAGQRGPDVVNGDGDRTGFSAVETGTDQVDADVQGRGDPLSGYVAPSAPS